MEKCLDELISKACDGATSLSATYTDQRQRACKVFPRVPENAELSFLLDTIRLFTRHREKYRCYQVTPVKRRSQSVCLYMLLTRHAKLLYRPIN